MPSDGRREHMVNAVVAEAMTMAEELVDALRETFGYQMGADEVGTREVRALIRKALAGDAEAETEVTRLILSQPGVPNPMIAELDRMLRERGY